MFLASFLGQHARLTPDASCCAEGCPIPHRVTRTLRPRSRNAIDGACVPTERLFSTATRDV